LVLLLLISSGNVFAQDSKTMAISSPIQEPIICFKESDASQIVVKLENYPKLEDNIRLLKEENAELEKKINNLNEIIKSQEIVIANSEKTIKKLEETIITQKKAYEKQIEESKPSIWRYIGTAIGSLAVGLCIGLLI